MDFTGKRAICCYMSISILEEKRNSVPKNGSGCVVCRMARKDGSVVEKNQERCGIYIFCIFAADFKNSFL